MINHDTLHVAAVQYDLHWENRLANLNNLEKLVEKLKDKPVDLIILPEMFTTGFTMNARQCAEKTEGKSLEWMRKQSSRLNAAITGSIIVEEHDQYYNRMYFVWPDGEYRTYDKRHTFSYVGEDKVFEKGTNRLIVDYKGWKICPLICYDLRFPVWSRNTEEFDVLIYVANWPESRILAWDTLLRARAIENLCYTIGVNRVGNDGNQINYNGHSSIHDPLGKRFTGLEDEEAGIVSGQLEKKELNKIRNKFRFLDDRDEYEIKI